MSLASMIYKFSDKKSVLLVNKSGSGGAFKNENVYEELHEPIIRKFKKRKVYSPFSLRFLLCVIDILSKYAWVIPLKDKKGTTITNAFQKLLD